MRVRVLCLLAAASFLLFSVAGVAQASVNNPPTADPNGPYAGIVGFPVTFDGTGSYDPDGDPLSYEWDFGDGSLPVSDTPTPTHTYSVAATYSVMLTVRDGRGGIDSAVTTATIGGAFLTAHKWDDINKNGVQEAGEIHIEGWQIELYQSEDGGATWTLVAEGHTGPTGTVTFNVPAPRLYKVVEEDVPFWTPTITNFYTVNAESGASYAFEFGNAYEPTAVPEFSLALPILTSLVAALYLILRKRVGKNLG